MAKKKRRRFTAEFKAATVRLVEEVGKSIAEVARELELTQELVRNWVRQHKIDGTQGDLLVFRVRSFDVLTSNALFVTQGKRSRPSLSI